MMALSLFFFYILGVKWSSVKHQGCKSLYKFAVEILNQISIKSFKMLVNLFLVKTACLNGVSGLGMLF